MRRVSAFLPLLLLACDGPEQSVGHILVVAQPLTAAAQLTAVKVSISPAGITDQVLTVDPQDPTKFSGTFTVPVGAQTVQADAFAGSIKVGTGTATVTVSKGAQMQALITILDST